MFQVGHGEIERHLAFRDYLRTHLDAQISYCDLKERLAQEFSYDIDSYINGKNSHIKEIEIKALRWYKANKEELKTSKT